MKADTVIIGSGVAATSVAQKLLEADPQASVLILEAGVRVKTKDYGLWEQYILTRQTPYDQFTDLPYPTRDIPGENTSAGGTEMPLNGARVLGQCGTLSRVDCPAASREKPRLCPARPDERCHPLCRGRRIAPASPKSLLSEGSHSGH